LKTANFLLIVDTFSNIRRQMTSGAQSKIVVTRNVGFKSLLLAWALGFSPAVLPEKSHKGPWPHQNFWFSLVRFWLCYNSSCFCRTNWEVGSQKYFFWLTILF